MKKEKEKDKEIRRTFFISTLVLILLNLMLISDIKVLEDIGLSIILPFWSTFEFIYFYIKEIIGTILLLIFIHMLFNIRDYQ